MPEKTETDEYERPAEVKTLGIITPGSLKAAAYACIAVSIGLVVFLEWSRTGSGTAAAILAFVASALLMEAAERIERKKIRGAKNGKKDKTWPRR